MNFGELMAIPGGVTDAEMQQQPGANPNMHLLQAIMHLMQYIQEQGMSFQELENYGRRADSAPAHYAAAEASSRPPIMGASSMS